MGPQGHRGGSKGSEGSFVIFEENPNNVKQLANRPELARSTKWDPKVTGGSKGSEGSFVIFEENPNNVKTHRPKQSKFSVFGDWDPKFTEGCKTLCDST